MSTGFERRLAWFRDTVEKKLRGELMPVAPPPGGERSELLRDLLRLDAAQLDFVWACVCVSADPLLYGPIVSIGGPDGRRGLAVATYAALAPVQDPAGLVAWLHTEPAVLRLGLLAAAKGELLPGATPFAAARRLVTFLAGSDEIDPAVAALGGHVSMPSSFVVDPGHQPLIERLAELLASPERQLVVITGTRGRGRRTLVAAACEGHRPVIAIDASRATLGSVSALHREALLLGAVPVVSDAHELLTDASQSRRDLATALDASPRSVVVTTTDRAFDCPVRMPIRRLDVPAPTAPTRVTLWNRALATPVEPAIVEELAMRYPLGPGAIRDASQLVAPGKRASRADLIACVRGTVVANFGGLADHLEVSDRWEDVVLAPETADQVEALVARVRYAYRVYEEWKFPRNTARGGGVAALFSGPPGTGKTLVAGLIARELDRDLFRVDLSRVVSKWVGETEKQLGALFDAAETSDALLLFDEADSLFAKRTEVKSASDRYANLEVNYLLQRIETFQGVTILTTNLDTSIDAALRRRLAAHIVFWPPDQEERARLWQHFATCGAPTSGRLRFDELAREFPDMTGANIRNASLAAAFLAAASNQSLSQEVLVRAARSEYRAMGRVLGRT
jgi:hypothetical protein